MKILSLIIITMITSCSYLEKKHSTYDSREIASTTDKIEVLIEANNCELVVYKDPSNYLAIKKYDDADKKNYQLFWLSPLTGDYKIDTTNDMYKNFIKKDGNVYKNSYYKVGNNRGIHQFSFENLDDLKSLKKFQAIQSAGFGENAMFPVLNLSKKIIAECNF